jgi:hypothetical protein
LIEGRHDTVKLETKLSVGWRFDVFSGSKINFLENLALLVASEDLLDNADWSVVLGPPWRELG